MRGDGFDHPAHDAARAFRVAMEAVAHPGRILTLDGPAPEGLSQAAATLLLTLADATTPVHLAGRAAAARRWLTFQTGAPDTPPGGAAFAVGDWAALGPLDAYPAGTPDYPDRAATLIVELAELSAEGSTLTGPGIATEAHLSLPDADVQRANAARYPLGVDLFLCAGDRVAALPRSTRIAGVA